MKQEDKQLISKDFNISNNSMKSALGTLTSIRNICAHDDRLYPYRSTFYVNINKIYHKTIIELKKTNYTTIFIVILLMQKLLDSNMQKNFNSELKLCFRDLEKSISSISINDIKNVMGIPKDYNFE